jgi:hypothetical protein
MPLLLATAVLLRAIISPDYISWTLGFITTSLLGLASICFVYLGKLQACNDHLVTLELAVRARDYGLLLEVMMSSVRCMGNLSSLLTAITHVRRL